MVTASGGLIDRSGRIRRSGKIALDLGSLTQFLHHTPENLAALLGLK
jgi:hypothetical protein